MLVRSKTPACLCLLSQSDIDSDVADMTRLTYNLVNNVGLVKDGFVGGIFGINCEQS